MSPSGKEPQRTDPPETSTASEVAETWARQVAPSLAPQVRGKNPFEIQTFANEHVNNQPEKGLEALAQQFGVTREEIAELYSKALVHELLPLAGYEIL